MNNLIKRNPFLSIQTELDKAINDFHQLFIGQEKNLRTDFDNFLITPSVDLIDDKENIKVVAEMPGMGEEDIKVNISGNALVIKGEKSTSKQDKGKNYFKREIGYGSYERTIPLPPSVDPTKAKASFKKGMLWVVIPKRQEAMKECREIPVERIKE
ncbi:MAG: Hsp20/alpha crystallin family protein [Gammaproteobacteria bacterium]|nr:Hsp20/alpha crystallin family protein [Gammaproteobacteria bacterium]